jgi:hypothetical protein
MGLDQKISRRRLLSMGAGGAALAALAPFAGASVLATPATGMIMGRLIPAGKLGTITFTQRDVPSRQGIATGNATMGFLGGANFPEDPTDLGPLVPLPGGWRELLEYLANLGYKQIEFAGYGQNAANPGGGAPNPAPGGVTTPESRAAYLAYGQTLRGFLDEFDLEAIGNHGSSRTRGRAPAARAAPCRPTTTSATRPSSSSPPFSACRSWVPATTRRAPTTGTSSRGPWRARNGKP